MNRRKAFDIRPTNRSICLVACLASAIVYTTHAQAQDAPAAAGADERSARSWGTLNALGVEIQPGTKQRLNSMPMTDFVGMRMAVPVWIARGQPPGRTMAVTAGIHCDELNGVEIARRVFVETDPTKLSGTLVVLPVLNRYGFLAGSRYMSTVAI